MNDLDRVYAHMWQNDQELRQVIRDLLASADASWEERREGHDWHEACEQARAALATNYDEWGT